MERSSIAWAASTFAPGSYVARLAPVIFITLAIGSRACIQPLWDA